MSDVLNENYVQDETEKMTCHGCPFVDDCDWAWDAYNTLGDCLAEK